MLFKSLFQGTSAIMESLEISKISDVINKEDSAKLSQVWPTAYDMLKTIPKNKAMYLTGFKCPTLHNCFQAVLGNTGETSNQI